MFADLELYLSFTEECNWKCFYCGYPNKKTPKKISLEEFKEIAEWMKPIIDKHQMQICVEGGETGLIDESVLDYLFLESGINDEQNNKFHVATNGLFFHKKYHERYWDVLRSILYHVLPDVIDPKQTFKKYSEEHYKMYHTIVIHKGNIDIMEEFFKRNSECLFAPHVIQPRIKNLDIMDLSYYQQIYEISKNSPNVTSGFTDRYKDIIKQFENQKLVDLKRQYCCQNYKKMIIDLPNRVIYRCCVSMETDSIPLTPENLEATLSNTKQVFPKWDNVCTDCIAGFIFRDYPQYIKNEMITKMKQGIK